MPSLLRSSELVPRLAGNESCGNACPSSRARCCIYRIILVNFYVTIMIYLFQRIIQNHFQWVRPSPGRLGPHGEGEYVQKNGFGHEDWNFNSDLAINGFLYGYCYYRPAPARLNENFNIVFATYVNGKWYAVGFYLNATFTEKPPIVPAILQRKKDDLLQLGSSLGKPWRHLSDTQFFKKLGKDANWLNWKVKTMDALRTARPVEIPKSVFEPSNYRITKPTEIDKQTFDAIFARIVQDNPQEDIMGEDLEFPEGREVEQTHKLRERNALVVTIAKQSFKKKHGRLFCQICGFDFAKTYGDLGVDFIEAHHTLPVSAQKGIFTTKPNDIALVCPNCHRMLHRRRPWLAMKALRNLLQ